MFRPIDIYLQILILIIKPTILEPMFFIIANLTKMTTKVGGHTYTNNIIWKNRMLHDTN